MKDIHHIFFDLDHTLWDYDRSARETLYEIFEKYVAPDYCTPDRFVRVFHEVNNKLWSLYNESKIDREYIKKERFREVFEQIDADINHATEVSEYFIKHCSSKPYLMDDALTALNYLHGKYQLHIITNGFKDSQGHKITASGIANYFDIVVTSECANAKKPDPVIFEYSLKKAGATSANSIMVGDNTSTDIRGAKNIGMRTLLYDPSGTKRSLADYTIQTHMQLIKLF